MKTPLKKTSLGILLAFVVVFLSISFFNLAFFETKTRWMCGLTGGEYQNDRIDLPIPDRCTYDYYTLKKSHQPDWWHSFWRMFRRYDCNRIGGFYVIQPTLVRFEVCEFPTPGEGDPCTSSSQCRQACVPVMYMSDPQDNGKPAQGICSGLHHNNPNFCGGTIENGKFQGSGGCE